jgi:hypothetical protein
VSTVPPAPGWWLASDENWYPPETHPAYRAQTPERSRAHQPGQIPSFQSWLAAPAATPVTLAAPRAPMPSPVPTAFGPTGYQGSSDSGISAVQRIGPRSRIGRWHVVGAAGAVVLVLAVLSPLVLNSSPTAKLPAGRSDRLVSGSNVQGGTNPAPSTPAATSATEITRTTDWLSGHGSPARAVTIARSVANSMWTARESALASGNVTSLNSLETGPALQIDIFHLAMVQCGCQQAYTITPTSGLQVLIPQQSQYPLDFLAAFETEGSSTPELMVLTKSSSSSPWLVSFDTETDDSKLSVTSPQAIPVQGQPAGVDAPAPTAASELGLETMTAYISSYAANGGHPPQSTAFGDSDGAIDLAGKFASPASGTTQIPPSNYSNVASTTPGDGIWSFAATGMEPGETGLVCGTIRDTTSNEATTATPLTQNGQYGPFLAPGSYRTITQVAGMETCVVSLANGSIDDFGDNVGGISVSGTPA